MTVTKKPISLPRDTTALALFGIMFLGLGLIGGSSLWGPVSNSHPPGVKPLAAANTTAVIETEQRRQADVLKTLGRNFANLANQQDTVVKMVDHSDSTVNDRFGKLEAEISTLELKLRGNADNALATEVDQLTISGALVDRCLRPALIARRARPDVPPGNRYDHHPAHCRRAGQPEPARRRAGRAA